MQFLNGMNTYTGIIVALLPSVLNLFGVHIVPGQTEEFNNLISDGITLIGSLYAFYGRARASTPGILSKNK